MPRKKKKKADDLFLKRKPAWEKFTKKQRKEAMEFCEKYADFLSRCKTERETFNTIKKEGEDEGYMPADEVKNVKAGDRLYYTFGEKVIALVIAGSEHTFNIIGAHTDSPRLDLKQIPVYDDDDAGIAYLKTHYYGGIRKYHWVGMPLAIHGRIVLENGEKVDVCLGEGNDPIFFIQDLPPHLSRRKQNTRHLPEGIKGEELCIIASSLPDDESKGKKYKSTLIKLLEKKYGIKEEDLMSAELEAVPAGPARDAGLDSSMLVGYGQDDRACAYTVFRAIMNLKKVERTAVAFFFDKEEIGSDGVSGAKSRFLEYVIHTTLQKMGCEDKLSSLHRALLRSDAISADVSTALGPTFQDVHEKQNAARLGHGVVMTKFTGSGGKYSASDASAEYVARIRKILNKNKIPWQMAEIGKVDEGGGGTIAKYIAQHSINVVDMGPPLLSMHSPWELSHKADIYSSYLSYLSFYRDNR